VDVAPPGRYYRLSAMDVNSNESSYAALGPFDTLDVPGGGSLALHGVRPNPSLGEPLQVAFTLPNAAPARLDLVDVAGRLVARREVGSLGGGNDAVDLAAEKRLAPGLSLVRDASGWITDAREGDDCLQGESIAATNIPLHDPVLSRLTID
jgi:hypothetical protein